MTDDPMLDASEITVQVSKGEVTLSGTVPSRDQSAAPRMSPSG